VKGLSLVELVVALAVVLLAAAAGAEVLALGIDAVGWQPASAELAARARAAGAIIGGDLAAAGAGPIAMMPPADPALARVDAGRLGAWVPAVLPRVVGLDGADADTVAARDRFSVLAIGDAAPQALVARSGGDYALRDGPTCPDPGGGCGFGRGMPVLLLARAPGFQLAQVDAIAGGILSLGGLAVRPGEAVLARADVVSYRYDPVRGELLRGRAGGRGQPLLDHLAAFEVELWGSRVPPAGPRWDAGASCVVAADGAPSLPLLAGDAEALAALDPATLADGPWCGVPPFRYDADLLRVRRVRLRARFVADADTARGADPARFAVPGRARRPGQEVPDLDLRIDVAPPALRGAP
jgi:hypothetical protein